MYHTYHDHDGNPIRFEYPEDDDDYFVVDIYEEDGSFLEAMPDDVVDVDDLLRESAWI